MAASPQIDASTYTGKLKILSDVRANKIKLPKNFPSLADLDPKNNKMTSTTYQKTAQRRIQIDSKRTRIQDKFV